MEILLQIWNINRVLLSNNPEEGKKVISSIEEELLRCEQFQISVAFITMGGVTPLLQTLKELERKRIPGQILTTNYLDFSEPRALAKLNELNEKSNPPAMLGRIRRDVREIIATLCQYKNVGNIVFRQKYIYGASFPSYDVWHISHSSEAF